MTSSTSTTTSTTPKPTTISTTQSTTQKPTSTSTTQKITEESKVEETNPTVDTPTFSYTTAKQIKVSSILISMKIEYKRYDWNLPGNKRYLESVIRHYKKKHKNVHIENDLINE